MLPSEQARGIYQIEIEIVRVTNCINIATTNAIDILHVRSVSTN